MSRLIESIKVLDGKFCNLFYHEQRMIRSLEGLFGSEEDIHLEKFLNTLDAPQKGLFKCRILYDDRTKEVEFVPYKPKSIMSLKVVEHNRISYEYKLENRRIFEKLLEQRENCDDILIVKRGRVTDSSFANIIFERGNQWITPWSALLKGTMRQNLLDHNKIAEEEILATDIKSFKKFKLINAMLEFDGPEIDVSNIVF